MNGWHGNGPFAALGYHFESLPVPFVTPKHGGIQNASFEIPDGTNKFGGLALWNFIIEPIAL